MCGSSFVLLLSLRRTGRQSVSHRSFIGHSIQLETCTLNGLPWEDISLSSRQGVFCKQPVRLFLFEQGGSCSSSSNRVLESSG